MKSYISKVGVSLVAFALVVAPALVLAQTAIVASINTPANGATVTVNQPVTFSGSATGGTAADYKYRWTWSDNSTPLLGGSVTKTFTSTGVQTITLAVSDFDTTGTKSITVNVVNGTTPADVVISNIRVTDITQTSAVVRWTTDVPSTSRVIYDTTSHPSITGESAPNYGYANSSAKIDIDTKVTEHVVTLTGLSANTHYFFRVLSAK